MILFIDTEWADVLASELVSLALVSDCGRYEFYAERDPLPDKATEFVRSVVYPLLERGTRALPDEMFTAALHLFFEEVLEVAWRGKVLVAFDHRTDMALLDYALDGFESPKTPQRPPFSRFNLGLLGIEFDQAVEERFASDPTLRARRHNAFTDAWVNRDAYLMVRDRAAWELSEFQRVREGDQEISRELDATFDTLSKAASWWTSRSRVLGRKPCDAYAAGSRAEVIQELNAIRHGMPS